MSQTTEIEKKVTLSSHILDTHLGKPASNIAVTLHHIQDEKEGKAVELMTAHTNDDGRVTNDDWQLDTPLSAGRYTLTFATKDYFDKQGLTAFYPQAVIDFMITDASHYHIPLLLSAHGYSTYRGS